jgi:hypothetical protein
VCALGAMWASTRSLLFANDHTDGALAAITDLDNRVERAGRLGAVRFWDLLLDFVKGARPPVSWMDELGCDHPVVATYSDDSRRLKLNKHGCQAGEGGGEHRS